MWLVNPTHEPALLQVFWKWDRRLHSWNIRKDKHSHAFVGLLLYLSVIFYVICIQYFYFMNLDDEETILSFHLLSSFLCYIFIINVVVRSAWYILIFNGLKDNCIDASWLLQNLLNSCVCLFFDGNGRGYKKKLHMDIFILHYADGLCMFFLYNSISKY